MDHSVKKPLMHGSNTAIVLDIDIDRYRQLLSIK